MKQDFKNAGQVRQHDKKVKWGEKLSTCAFKHRTKSDRNSKEKYEIGKKCNLHGREKKTE
jgi:hypothetical protein